MCDRGGAGVCDRVGLVGMEGVVGREDIDADLECMELNRERGEAAAAEAELLALE